MFPDYDIMTHLDKIIDLRPRADDRPAESGSIDGRVGTDLNIRLDHDATDLRYLFVAPPGELIPKTIRANDHTRLKPDTFMDLRLSSDTNTRLEPTIVPDMGVTSDKNLSLQMDAFADNRSALNHTEGPHGRTRRHACRRRDHGGRVNSRFRFRPERLFNPRTKRRECSGRIFHQKKQLTGRGIAFVLLREKNHRSLARPDLRLVFWTAEKGQIPRLSGIESRDSTDTLCRGSPQTQWFQDLNDLFR